MSLTRRGREGQLIVPAQAIAGDTAATPCGELSPCQFGYKVYRNACGTALSFVIFMILALLEGRLVGIFWILFLATALCWGHPDITVMVVWA